MSQPTRYVVTWNDYDECVKADERIRLELPERARVFPNLGLARAFVRKTTLPNDYYGEVRITETVKESEYPFAWVGVRACHVHDPDDPLEWFDGPTE